MMKLIVTCGGTGGHITPALAIAHTVKENCPNVEILFVGSERGMENTLVREAGFPIQPLRVEGLSRSLSLTNIRAFYRVVTAVKKARAILVDFAPDIVIGTGGYACYPTLRAAVKMGIPTAVHESNAVAGLAVRRLAAKVDRVWLNFDAAGQALPKGARTLTVGNPLPRGCNASRAGGRQRRDGCRRVLSFGGSLGARELNRAVLSLMEREREMPDICHCHATGKREYEATHGEFCAKGLDTCPRLELLPYIGDMPRRMAEADVVICRAGAMSISELAALGAPAVLVPSPNVTGNHQYRNAKVLSDAGAAVLLTEKGLVQTLPETVMGLLVSSEKRHALSSAIRAFARPDANRLIYEDICRLIRK